MSLRELDKMVRNLRQERVDCQRSIVKDQSELAYVCMGVNDVSLCIACVIGSHSHFANPQSNHTHACMHACIRTYIHTYIHTYIQRHTYKQGDIQAERHAYHHSSHPYWHALSSFAHLMWGCIWPTNISISAWAYLKLCPNWLPYVHACTHTPIPPNTNGHARHQAGRSRPLWGCAPYARRFPFSGANTTEPQNIWFSNPSPTRSTLLVEMCHRIAAQMCWQLGCPCCDVIPICCQVAALQVYCNDSRPWHGQVDASTYIHTYRHAYHIYTYIHTYIHTRQSYI